MGPHIDYTKQLFCLSAFFLSDGYRKRESGFVELIYFIKEAKDLS